MTRCSDLLTPRRGDVARTQLAEQVNQQRPAIALHLGPEFLEGHVRCAERADVRLDLCENRNDVAQGRPSSRTRERELATNGRGVPNKAIGAPENKRTVLQFGMRRAQRHTDSDI